MVGAKRYLRCARVGAGTTRRKVRTELYRRWVYLISRTRGSSTKRPENYRGLRVGFADYAAFRAWALANGYRKGMSPDRIDTAKGYEPGNLRWVSVEFNKLRGFGQAGDDVPF